jgi:hypothetical protein
MEGSPGDYFPERDLTATAEQLSERNSLKYDVCAKIQGCLEKQ